MGKIAVVYWSGTGNTEIMANYVFEGAKRESGDVQIFTASEFLPSEVKDYDAIAFGCPSMGQEILEESEFEPMFSACRDGLKGKKIVLFGSYGWGDGEWMRNWEEVCISCGATLVAESVICNESPEDDTIENCKNLGESLAK